MLMAEQKSKILPPRDDDNDSFLTIVRSKKTSHIPLYWEELLVIAKPGATQNLLYSVCGIMRAQMPAPPRSNFPHSN